MAQQRYDVAILGLGPVGSLAAILLARAGLEVVAVERDEEVYKLPRAVNLDGEIVRALQPVGLAEQVDALLQKVRPGERVGFANSKREFLFGAEAVALGANGWQPMNFFDQPELEAFLREQALAPDNVTAFIGYEAESFSQDAEQASLRISGQGQSHTLQASYLLACDGASSSVRRGLGIEWINLGYDHDWLVVDVITKPGHTLELTTLQVCDPDRIATYVCTKDPYRRWEFKLNPGETWAEMQQPERIQSLLDPWTPRGTYEIRRAAVYQFHAATAATWRDHRIFIAGDAAHQTPPFLGQGMNSGMRDVVNFAWKLPMVLSGLCAPGMLDTYQSERDAHAHDLVDWAVALGQLMEHTAAVEAAQRAGETPPSAPAALQASGYGQGRDQPPLRRGVIVEQQVRDDGFTGYLFSQPLVLEPDSGRHVRMDELLGPGFCVVAKTAAGLQMSESSRDILQAIGARTLQLEGLQKQRGHFDRVFGAAETAIVRPDRCIFGYTDGDYDLDALIALLAEKLQLNAA